MTRSLTGALIALAALALAAPAAAEPAAVYERGEVVVEPPPGIQVTSLEVDNRLGDVRIEGHDHPTVIISAHKRGPDQATVERLKVSLIPDPNGPVRINTAILPGDDPRPIPPGAVRIDLVIRAPRAARVRAQVWNGHLAMAGMENGAELLANEGPIQVHNASGTIVTDAAAGDQQFVEIFGELDARVISGDMDLDTVRGQRLAANVHQGRIDGRRVEVRDVWVTVIRGDVRLRGRAVPGGRYRLGSYRGDVELALTTAGPVSLRAHARAGTISLPAGMRRSPGRVEGSVLGYWPGGSEQPAAVELRSRVGNIRFSLPQQ
ncbi:hypothetical protein [Haliangium sp.]|uniref:hypothetical protein n=1 Tax=Haliangium sp. TaxID=2663208 RepID=UPI003D0A276B